MAKYQADVWLGSASGRQRVYVNSNTWNGAREQIKTIYHVQDGDIWNLCESRGTPIDDRNEVSLTAVLALGIILLILYFWKYILALSAIIFVIWLIHTFSENKK